MQVRQQKSLFVAFALWLALGAVGAHRFYLGDHKGGSIMLALNVLSWVTMLFLIGFLGLFILFCWWGFDLFLLGRMTKAYNENVAQETKAFWEAFKK